MALPPTRASGPYRPTRLGQWEVIAKIAGGGMSAVYLGRRAEPSPDVPNVVALKIVRHDARMNERMLQMFLEEGRLIARLVHPNIVRTLEVGGDAEQDYIAMELMLGKTFAAIHDAIALRNVRLNADIAAWTAARIADALHYAHELADENQRPLGLVHRDVNPANVFATFDGEVKLFDFGLAKVTADDASGSQMLAGKLSYLSPEQIMQMPLDRRSDVFSLGTTLWELLTSRRLFRRDADIDTVRAVQLGPIPDPRSVAPEIPEELARIAKTALERNRDHRYPTAAHLARELDAFVFTRTSPRDVTARLAQLVDTLFPGEQKRQSGWLKPAISGSGSRQMNAVSGPSSIPASQGRPSVPRSLAPTEMTQVMPTAPPLPPEARAPSSSRGSIPGSQPSFGIISSRPEGLPLPRPPRAPSDPFTATPREGSVIPRRDTFASTPREGSSLPARDGSRTAPPRNLAQGTAPTVAMTASDASAMGLRPEVTIHTDTRPASGGPLEEGPITARDFTPPPMSSREPSGLPSTTPKSGRPGVPSSAPPTPRAASTHTLASARLEPTEPAGPISARSWPFGNARESAVPPPPPRGRPTLRASVPPPPAAPEPGPEDLAKTEVHGFSLPAFPDEEKAPLSRTEIQSLPFAARSESAADPIPSLPDPAAETQLAPGRLPKASTPVRAQPSPSVPPPSLGREASSRLKRAPVPLPSRLAKPKANLTPSVPPPKPTITEPPSSDTQVDMPLPPPKPSGKP